MISKSFISNLQTLKKRSSFYDWRNAHELADELIGMLSDLENGVSDSEEAIKLLKMFFEADKDIIEQCDDSSGYVGGVFRTDATDLFSKYAVSYKDKNKLAEILMELVINNDYGLRDNLTDTVSDFLPQDKIREIADRLFNQDIPFEAILLKAFARALKDADMFEKIIQKENLKNEDYKNFQLGEIWFFCGDAKRAISYLEKVSKNSINFYNVPELLQRAYAESGDIENQKKIGWQIFRTHRTKDRLEKLILAEGRDLLQDELVIIKNESRLNFDSVDFLIELSLIDEAEAYVLARKNQLNGDHYGELIKWIDFFEKEQKLLISSLLYRALLESILEKAKSKNYHYAVRYLKRLDKISAKTLDWQNIISHEQYLEKLKIDHKNKRSFWERYSCRTMLSTCLYNYSRKT